jgi:hypothetical protein
MVANDFVLSNMLPDPPLIKLESMDVIFPSSGIHPQVKEFHIGIPFFDVCNASTLLFPCPFHNGKSNHMPFQPCPEVPFSSGKHSHLLGHVKV